jgi:hypothetical protein
MGLAAVKVIQVRVESFPSARHLSANFRDVCFSEPSKSSPRRLKHRPLSGIEIAVTLEFNYEGINIRIYLPTLTTETNVQLPVSYRPKS